MILRLTNVGLCLVMLYSTSRGQGLFENAISETDLQDSNRIEWNGYTRGSLFGGGKSYDYASVFGEFAILPKLNFKSSFLYADLRLREGMQFGKDTLIIQAKEVYAGYRARKLHVYVGNQIVQWGRTEGFNPTNNITPNDYFFLSAEPDDQKLSNTLIRFKYFPIPQIELELIGIPVYKSSTYRYNLFTINEAAQFIPAVNPNMTFENGSIAGRLNFEFTKIGYSLSYFNGFDPFYGFRIAELNLEQQIPIIHYIPDFYRKQVYGGDFAIYPGSIIIRGEFAYNHTKNYKDSMHIPNPDLAYVFGVESNCWGFTSIIQYIGKYVIDFTKLQPPILLDPNDPVQQLQYFTDQTYYESSLFNQKIFNQQKEYNHALFLSVSRMLAHDIIMVELSGYYNITSEEYLIRSSLKWKINDLLELRFGGSYMKGPENSIFDLSGTVLNGAFVELRVSF